MQRVYEENEWGKVSKRIVTICLHAECTQDLCRYDLPTANDEVTAIIPGDGSEQCSDHCDIILRLTGGGL